MQSCAAVSVEAFYAKRVRDFNDAQRFGAEGTGGFPETSPFVGIADAGVGPVGSGPVGWQTFQPEAQLWLYKYYGDTETMVRSFNATRAFVAMLDQNPPSLETGLGDWMPIDSTSTAFTGLGFQRMAYLAFANISSIVGGRERRFEPFAVLPLAAQASHYPRYPLVQKWSSRTSIDRRPSRWRSKSTPAFSM